MLLFPSVLIKLWSVEDGSLKMYRVAEQTRVGRSGDTVSAWKAIKSTEATDGLGLAGVDVYNKGVHDFRLVMRT